jgi:SAM-dependent methyltransferase
MTFGETYACIFDFLYWDKDYEKECTILEGVFRTSGVHPHSILDLGCGTGNHALLLAQRGYAVTGIDQSDAMIEIATRKAHDIRANTEFIKGEIAHLRDDRKYDAVISMFAVMSYQLTDEEVVDVFHAVQRTLVPGGIFIFDCWHGPAVQTEKPSIRKKELETDDGTKILRLAEPEMDVHRHLVHVHYTFDVVKDGRFEKTSETHTMRFFFPENLQRQLETAGFERIRFYPFPEINNSLSERDWNMMVVSRKSAFSLPV